MNRRGFQTGIKKEFLRPDIYEPLSARSSPQPTERREVAP